MKQIIAGGLGYVGRAVAKLFPEAEIYDIAGSKELPKEKYDICHICTPTPMKEDGSCDVSSVFDVVGKIYAETYIIRSTVHPGFTNGLQNQFWDEPVYFVFQPEYIASSSPYKAPLGDISLHPFIILGGIPSSVKKARALYEKIYPPTTRFVEMSSLEAEITKLMENSFIATYVTFCNEFYDICQKYGVDWHKVREGFLADPRMTPWWSNIYPEKRGFSNSHCLPKDLNNLVASCRQIGYEPEFIKDILKNNMRWKNG